MARTVHNAAWSWLVCGAACWFRRCGGGWLDVCGGLRSVGVSRDHRTAIEAGRVRKARLRHESGSSCSRVMNEARMIAL